METECLKQNLEKIRKLTETVVPFGNTVKGIELIDDEKTAIMYPLHKEDKYAITVVEIEAGFLHQNHFHNEYEVVCLLEGELIMICDKKETPIPKGIPVVIEPQKNHMMFYPIKSRVLAITIPASPDFPND